MTHLIAGRPARAWPQGRTVQLRPPRLSWHRVVALILILPACLGVSAVGSTLMHLRTPDPTGVGAVGKDARLLQDASRSEAATAAPGDHRHVRVVAWYPAVTGTGDTAAYIEGLDRIGDGLVSSGAIDGFARTGLDLVTTAARQDASVAITSGPYPVVILSPGNATNVEFYGALAEELASHGYVVMGLDHPFQTRRWRWATRWQPTPATRR